MKLQEIITRTKYNLCPFRRLSYKCVRYNAQYKKSTHPKAELCPKGLGPLKITTKYFKYFNYKNWSWPSKYLSQSNNALKNLENYILNPII